METRSESMSCNRKSPRSLLASEHYEQTQIFILFCFLQYLPLSMLGMVNVQNFEHFIPYCYGINFAFIAVLS